MNGIHADAARGPRWRVFLLICVVGAIIYSPIMNADFSCDDICFIAWAKYAGPLDYLRRFTPAEGEMMYRPLYPAIWALSYRLWGGHASLLHIQLVAVHILIAWLLFLIALRLGRNGPFAAAAALLFVSSPLSVETVAWLNGVDDEHCLLLYLCALLSFIKIDDRPSARRGMLALSLVLGALALLVRESALSLPVTVLLCDILVIRPGKGMGVVPYLRERWRLYGVHFLLVFSFFAARCWMLGGMRGYGAGGVTYVPPMLEIAMDAFLRLPAMMILPLKSSTIHLLLPAYAARLLAEPYAVIAAFVLFCCIVVSLKRVQWRLVALGLGWCATDILLHWQVLHSIGLAAGNLEFSHYLYQPSVGFYLAVSALFLSGQEGWRRGLSTGIVAALVVAYSLVSLPYSALYRRSFHVAQTILRQFKEMRLPLPQGSRVFMMDVPTHIEGAPVWWGPTSITVWCDPGPSMGPVLERGLWHYSVEPAVRRMYPYRIFLLNRDVRLEERRNEYEAPPRFSLDYLRALKPGETDFFLRWLPREERLEDITALVRGKASKTPPPRPVSWTAGEIARGGQWAPFGDARIETAEGRNAVRLSVGPHGGGLRLDGAPFPPDERANIEMEAALLSPERAEAALEYRTEEEDRYDADKRAAFVLKAAPGFAFVRVPLTRRIYDLIDGKIAGCRIVFPAGHPAELEIRSIRLR